MKRANALALVSRAKNEILDDVKLDPSIKKAMDQARRNAALFVERQAQLLEFFMT